LDAIKVSDERSLATTLVLFCCSTSVFADNGFDRPMHWRLTVLGSQQLAGHKRADHNGDHHGAKPNKDFQKQAAGQTFHAPSETLACA
jgi:hypothetical protein